MAICNWGEARGEVFETKLAQAFVQVNRFHANGFGSDHMNIGSVILHKNAFSIFHPNDPNYRLLLKPAKHAPESVWDDCYFACKLAWTNSASDPSDGAQYYHDSRLGGPPTEWGKVALTALIGNLTFYKTL